MRFGISTHLYHSEPLSRDHLIDIAEHGFESIEVFATRSHFDYHDPEAISALGDWLRETGLTLHGIHAPVAYRFRDGRLDGMLSNSSTNPGDRAAALREAEAALQVARHITTGVFVVHLGSSGPEAPGARRGAAESRDMARRSLDHLERLAAPLGVRIGVEVIPNALSTPAALVRMLEEELDAPSLGICMDFGHGFLTGDLVDAIEVTAEHLITTHVHDNGGRSDDHLMPFEGNIDWPAAFMALQKIGYDGTLVFEVRRTAAGGEDLTEARRVRREFERMLETTVLFE